MKNGRLAQLVAHPLDVREVTSSSLVSSTKKPTVYKAVGFLFFIEKLRLGLVTLFELAQQADQVPEARRKALSLRKFESCIVHQISCLICLPDKSGNFLAFRAKIAQNTVKSTKTGSVVVDLTAAEPVFLIFRAKIPRTFWGKCTKQSSRKKAAVGGFEPQD